MPARFCLSATLTALRQTPEQASGMEGKNLGEPRELPVALGSEWTPDFDLSKEMAFGR
jgi:hypothetical protein